MELVALACVLAISNAVIRQWTVATLPVMVLFSSVWLTVYVLLTNAAATQVATSYENSLLGRFSGWCKAAFIAVAVTFATKSAEDLSRLWVATSLVSGLFAIGAVRVFGGKIARRMLRQGTLGNRIAIYGVGGSAVHLYEKLVNAEGQCVDSMFDERHSRGEHASLPFPVRQGLQELLARAKSGEIDTVIINLPWDAQDRIRGIVSRLEEVNVDVLILPPGGLVEGRRIRSVNFGPVQALALYVRPAEGLPALAKVVIDRVAALAALIMLAPLFAIVALAIRVESPGPVFFRQKRRGLNNEPFYIWKFRSMHHASADPNADHLTVRGDSRITRVGAAIRKLSIDELPQLFNILGGTMSLVGPRPHAYGAKAGDRLYEDVVGRYNARHRMLPGLTGLAQVRGFRGNTLAYRDIENRIASDLEYMERWSLSLDASIILRTVATVLFHRDAY